MASVLYIINPTGQGGGGTRTWAEFQALCPAECAAGEMIITERPGHAREIAARATGHDIIAAVGGDGTVDEVMSGLMDRAGRRPALAIVPAGTGNDIACDVGIRSVADAAAVLRAGHTHPVDLIRADWLIDGEPVNRYAFLFGIVGFSAAPMLKRWMKRALNPAVAYYLATFLQFLVYRPPHMTVRVDGRRFDGRFWMVIVGNAELSGGGGMCLAPGARTDDGVLNVTIIHARPKPKMLVGLLPKVASGDHIHEAGVDYFTGQTIEVEATPAAALDLDGEIFGTTPATFTVCPGAVRVLCRGRDPVADS